MKNPTITVVCTDNLLRALTAADSALRASRKHDKPSTEEFQTLIVQVVAARMKVKPTSTVSDPE